MSDNPIPQGLLDALNATLQAKSDADASKAADDDARGILSRAMSAQQVTSNDLANKTASLDTARKQLEAVEDAYFQVGAPPP